jgi:hypothetical protein
VDDVDQRAREIGPEHDSNGADGWQGRNTDADGFLRPLDDRGAPGRLSRVDSRWRIGTGDRRRWRQERASVTVHARDRGVPSSQRLLRTLKFRQRWADSR